MAQKPIPRGQIMVGVMLVAVLAASWRTVSLEGKRRHLGLAYEQAQQELSHLQRERALLTHELSQLHEDRVDQHEERVVLERELSGVRQRAGTVVEQVRTLRQELSRLQQRVDITIGELASARHDQETLRDENASLATQLELVTAEKQQLEAKLSSIQELKHAYRQVKQKIRARRIAAWRTRKEAQKSQDQRWSTEGNRGYIVRDGVLTVGIGTKLHVRVLEPQAAP